jgi:hypothetical protein
MIAIEWRSVAIVFTELLVTALAIYGLNKSRKIRSLFWRIAGLLLCGFVSLLGSFATMAFLALAGCDTHSALIYSPSGRVAARTNDWDAGATGGGTVVTLHWSHGFRSQVVYSGGWKSVVPSDIKWTNDSDLTIYYDSSYGPLYHPCTSTPQVKVSCIPR